MNNLNPFRFLLYQLYLFQLEEYDLVRFILLIQKTKGIPKANQRKQVVWTAKAKILFAIAITLQLLISSYLVNSWSLNPLFTILLFLFTCYAGYVFLSFAGIVIWPLDFAAKKLIIYRAKQYIKQFNNLTIIGVAGSYGKTTMKEVVSAILSEQLTVVKTPENINTPIGIARLILEKIKAETQIFVVEMGEYKPGDIADICDLVRPHIGIITGINEAHLERMRSLDNTVSTIFELVQHMDPAGFLVLNGDNEAIMQNYKKYIKNQKQFVYSSKRAPAVKTAFLGEYIKGVVQAASAIANYLHVGNTAVTSALSKLKPIPHRLEPIEGSSGVLVIDDSYNGNPNGVEEAIRVLGSYKNRRKIYITPGLVEAGESTEEIHKTIGKNLAKIANIVILIKNSVTPFIEQGLKENGFDEKNIVWFDDAHTAHANLNTIVRPHDVVLFQNDWPDNYV